MPSATTEFQIRSPAAAVPRAPTACCIVVPAPQASDYRRSIASLRNQTEPLDAIAVIADAVQGANCGGAAAIRWIPSEDGNQIAALNRAFAAVDSQLVFFLQAGDVWEPDHLAAMRRVYIDQPEQEFVFCDSADAPTSDGDDFVSADPQNVDILDLGYTAVATYLDLDYVGGPLSCLSMRRALLERIAPLPDDVDWRHHAEACLVFGASLVGARKCRLPRPLARLAAPAAGASHHYDHRLASDFSYRLKVLRLVGKLTRQLRLDADSLLTQTGMEYHAQPANDWATFVKYRRYVQWHVVDDVVRRRMEIGLYRRVKQYLRRRRSLGNWLLQKWLKVTLGRGARFASAS